MSSAPHYPLKKVRELVKNEEVDINGNAKRRAEESFGWGVSEILTAVTRLNISHFTKSAPSYHIQNKLLDFYKAKNLYENEDVFIHLYISDAGRLIINSFHEL